jgi:integrase
LVTPLADLIGAVKLGELTVADVRQALAKLAKTRATRTVQDAHNSLVRAIRYSEARDLVGRNVGALIRPPKGQEGRPSKALTLTQAHALIEAAESSRLHACIVLCLMTGCRTEEARALRWDHVDLDGSPDAVPPVAPHVAVWRSVRAHGDVKTERSRRTLQLPQSVVAALKSHNGRQAEQRLQAGPLWQDHGLVFASTVGTPLDAHNVRRTFSQVVKPLASREPAVHGTCTTRSCRSCPRAAYRLRRSRAWPATPVSPSLETDPVSPRQGVNFGAALTSSTRTTETIYRREPRPVIATGAVITDQIFGEAPG